MQRMKLSDEEILSAVSEHTTEMKAPLWLRQIRYNEQHYGFAESLKGLQSYSNRKAVVLAAGPAFKRFGLADLQKVVESKPILVSCDGALPMLASIDIAPDYVVSVDAHPVVANFYRRSRNILGKTTAILSTTINKDVINECKAAGARVRWMQGFFKPATGFYREGVDSINSGGNVGTTSYIITALIFGCRPIGLMGLEFAWSDETPYNDTQYFKELQRVIGFRHPERISKFFKRIQNRRDGRTYIADPVYYSYMLMFREIWGKLPQELRRQTYNLTRQGILTAPGLKTVSAEEFVGI